MYLVLICYLFRSFLMFYFNNWLKKNVNHINHDTYSLYNLFIIYYYYSSLHYRGSWHVPITNSLILYAIYIILLYNTRVPRSHHIFLWKCYVFLLQIWTLHCDISSIRVVLANNKYNINYDLICNILVIDLNK